MKGSELKKRRLDAYMTQYDLATKIGVTVDTIRRWERMGDRELPFAANRKIGLAKIGPREPDIVAAAHAHLRPDLKLYGQRFSSGHTAYGPEHPRFLLPYLADEPTIPWSVLDSEEYIAALELHRAAEAAKADQPLSPAQEQAARLLEKYLEENKNNP